MSNGLQTPHFPAIPPNVRTIVFDAVGTLMHADPPVATAYATIGRHHGADLPEAEVKRRFAAAFQQQFVTPEARNARERRDAPDDAASPSGDTSSIRATSEERERLLWRRVVADVFREWPNVQGPLFEELWEHFARGRNWALFPDVAEVWQNLSRRGYELAIGSNFDARLERLCRELPPLDRCSQVFTSAQLGWAKPDVGFFRAVERVLGRGPEELLLVGDDARNDVAGATAAGWHVRWIVRGMEPAPAGALADLRELLRGEQTSAGNA